MMNTPSRPLNDPSTISTPASTASSVSRDLGIATKDLCLWYTKFQALRNVTVNIREGQITSLIGPSGCGKTTLLRCFNRVNERYSYVTTTGEIKILGKNIGQ